MIEIDITELLEEYVRLLEKGGTSRESTESKIMLKASEEIKKLRASLELQINIADENNNKRLRQMDAVHRGMELYEHICKDIQERTEGTYVCGMCRNECKGEVKNNCFELDTKRYRNIVFKKE